MTARILGPGEWNERQLWQVAYHAKRYIERVGSVGTPACELANHVWAYHTLTSAQRFRVQVLLCRMPEVSVVLTNNVTGPRGMRFYAAAVAPPGAFNVAGRRGVC